MSTILTTKPLDFFKPDPNNPRKSLDETELLELRESLREKQVIPLLARADGTIIDGWRRWRAARIDGTPRELDVIITDDPLSPAQVLEIQIASSWNRADLSPFEKYQGVMWLAKNTGATEKALGAKFGCDPSLILRILSLSDCIPEVKAAAAEGKVSISAWYAISKVPKADQHILLAAKLAGATRDQLEQRGRKIRNGSASTVKVNRIKVPLDSLGRSVTVAGTDLTLEDAVEILQEALRSAKKGLTENLDARTWGRVMQQRSKAGSQVGKDCPNS